MRCTDPSRPLPALAAVIVTAVAVMAPAVVGVPFFTKGEPREALVVQQMAATGDPILPLLERGEIQSKPPLFHWLGLAASALGGDVTETTVRIPSLAGSALVLALTAAAALRAAGAAAALASAVVLATSFLWLQASTIARVDMTLAAAVSTALFAFDHAWSRGDARVPAMFWLAAAAAVLAKGPVGVVLPAVIVTLYLGARGQLRLLANKSTLNLGAACLAALIPLLWYVPAALEGGLPFIEKHVLKENVLRVLDAEGVGAGHVKPFWFYGPALLAGFAPWSPLLLPAGLDAWRRRDRLATDGTLFVLVWAAATILFYSLAGSKRGIYLLPCYPALALIVGRWLSARFVEQVPVAPRESLPVLVTAVPAVLAVAASSLVGLDLVGTPTLTLIAPLLSTHDAANLSAVSDALAAHRVVAWAWAVAVLLLAVGLLRAGRDGRPIATVAIIAALVATTTVAVGSTVLPELARRLSLRTLLEATRSQIGHDVPLSFYRGFEYLEYVRPSAAYYSGRAIPVVDSIAALGGGPAWFLVAESRLDALVDEAASAAGDGRGTIYEVRVVAQQTYGGSPRREPLLLVEAAPVKTNR